MGLAFNISLLGLRLFVFPEFASKSRKCAAKFQRIGVDDSKGAGKRASF
jgi:hypothetical protein